ncbi:MAG: hypothetical protein M1370_02405 [Bacteroidetes bacterium]|nr:hypothetical protein [Bacteroidota bacterium]
MRAAEAAGTGGLLVGSGGLAGALAAELASKGAGTGNAPYAQAAAQQGASGQARERAAVLVLAGSYSAVTARQVEVALDAGANLVELDLTQALPDNGPATAALAAAVTSALRHGDGVVVRPVGPLRRGAELQVAALMAEVARQALGQALLGGLFLTGGDIAMATCRVLGATSIAVVGEVAPGLPAGRLQGGPYAGLRVVTKAGAFGAEDAIQRAMEFLSTVEG